jgi:hypothetical protein
MAGLTPLQIEDDAQENQVSDDNMSDIRSPATDEIVSPASQDSRAKVGPARPQLHAHLHIHPSTFSDPLQPNRLNTAVPVRTRADSDDAPQSVIHAPAHFKQFVCFVSSMVALPRR